MVELRRSARLAAKRGGCPVEYEAPQKPVMQECDTGRSWCFDAALIAAAVLIFVGSSITY
jgi:hypothetical protein